MEIENNTHSLAGEMTQATIHLVTRERLEEARRFVAAAIDAQATRLEGTDLANIYAKRLALTVALQEAALQFGRMLKKTYETYKAIDQLDTLGL